MTDQLTDWLTHLRNAITSKKKSRKYALNRRFQHVLELVEAKVKLFQKKIKTVSNHSKQNYNGDENHKGRREVSFLTFHTNTSESWLYWTPAPWTELHHFTHYFLISKYDYKINMFICIYPLLFSLINVWLISALMKYDTFFKWSGYLLTRT